MAHHSMGEAKFEELTVIFAPYVDNVVLVSSTSESEKRFVLVDEDTDPEDEGAMESDNLNADLVHNHQSIADVVEELAIVPYVNPEEQKPLQMIPPLDMIGVSSSTTESSLFNWWEQISLMSDDEGSTATNTSTANSIAFATVEPKGIRHHTSRYKNKSPVKPSIRLSSTASNSPLAKPPRK